jgi:hypothetical protein
MDARQEMRWLFERADIQDAITDTAHQALKVLRRKHKRRIIWWCNGECSCYVPDGEGWNCQMECYRSDMITPRKLVKRLAYVCPVLECLWAFFNREEYIEHLCPMLY